MAPLNILRLTPNSGLYIIQNKINNKFYIGSSKNVKEAFKYHKRLSTWKNHPNHPLYKDMLAFGIENFDFRMYKESEPKDFKQRKIDAIIFLKPEYNVRSVRGIDIEKQKAAQLRYRQSEKGKATQLRASLKYRENLKLRKAQYKEYEKQYDQLCKYGYNDNEQTILSLVGLSTTSLSSVRQTREYTNNIESPVKRVLVAE